LVLLLTGQGYRAFVTQEFFIIELTNSIELSPSWEVTGPSAAEEFYYIL
jgi:hypothetical protein